MWIEKTDGGGSKWGPSLRSFKILQQLFKKWSVYFQILMSTDTQVNKTAMSLTIDNG